MKICLTCNTSYSDDSLNFCLNDGTMLTQQRSSFPNTPTFGSSGEIPTQVSRLPELTSNPPPPRTVYSSFNQNPQFVAPTFGAQQQNTGSNRGVIYAIVAVVAVVFGVAVGLLIAANWNNPKNVNVATNNKNASNALVSNAANNANRASSNSNSTNESNKPTQVTYNLVGSWKGTFDGSAATLEITSQTGESFTGTLGKLGYVVKFVGQINSEKRTVSMKETEVLKTPPGSAWNLGVNNGTISEGGKTMSGTGKDKNISYKWNFTKQ